jgi:hypothetical protein
VTRHRDFKQLVRERMAKTGERYAAARAQLLALRGAAPAATETYPGVFPGYDTFGGIQGNTGAVCNVLRHAGVRSPITGAPYTEAEVNGLCGGPGFLYAVFEYKGWPPMLTLALQGRSMADEYVALGLSRLGVDLATSETTSPEAARKSLDAALSAQKAALCTVDVASLSYYGLPAEFAGAGPHVVAVVGADDTGVWIDDRGARPRHLSFEELATARARYRQGRHRLVTVNGSRPGHDAAAAMQEAITDTARTYTTPAVPKSFRVNCGFSGLDKWRQMLVDRRDKKGWPTLFAEGPRAYAGLQRAYECIESGIAPGAGRALYADFLDEAAAALKGKALGQAAAAYRESASHWTNIASLIADCGDRAIRDACEIAHRRLEIGDHAAAGESKEAVELWTRRQDLASACTLPAAAATALYGRIAEMVGRIAETERRAVALMDV